MPYRRLIGHLELTAAKLTAAITEVPLIKEYNSRPPCECVKPWIVPDPICTLFFPIHDYLQESLIYRLDTERDEHNNYY